MAGYRVYTGIVVMVLGMFGIAKYFGGTEATTTLINNALDVVGAVWAAYFNYVNHQG